MTDKSNQPDTPKTGPGKAIATLLSGAVATIFFWAWASFLPTHPMNAEVQAAFQTVFMLVAVWKTPHDFGSR